MYRAISALLMLFPQLYSMLLQTGPNPNTFIDFFLKEKKQDGEQ